MDHKRGSIIHFYEHAVFQCYKSLKKARIKESKYNFIIFTPRDNSYLVTYRYNSDSNAYIVRFDATDSRGNTGECVFLLEYHAKRKAFTSSSKFGDYDAQDLLVGKYPDVLVSDSAYDAVLADEIVPAMATDKNGKTERFQESCKQVHWRGDRMPAGWSANHSEEGETASNPTDSSSETEQLVEVVELFDESGEKVVFEVLDAIEYERHKYLILSPYDETESDTPADVFIMRETTLGNGEDSELEPVEDATLLDIVYGIFKTKNGDEFRFED